MTALESHWSVVSLVGLDAKLLEEASRPFQTVVGTLDAIHLVTASRIKAIEKRMIFLTHDRQMALAARSLRL